MNRYALELPATHDEFAFVAWSPPQKSFRLDFCRSDADIPESCTVLRSVCGAIRTCEVLEVHLQATLPPFVRLQLLRDMALSRA